MKTIVENEEEVDLEVEIENVQMIIQDRRNGHEVDRPDDDKRANQVQVVAY